MSRWGVAGVHGQVLRVHGVVVGVVGVHRVLAGALIAERLVVASGGEGGGPVGGVAGLRVGGVVGVVAAIVVVGRAGVFGQVFVVVLRPGRVVASSGSLVLGGGEGGEGGEGLV